MLVEQQLLVTIPANAREKLNLVPGEYVTYEEQEEPSGIRYIQVSAAKLSSHGANRGKYRISPKGQITVPKALLNVLGILERNELDIIYENNTLKLIKDEFLQFKALISSKRPSFFSDMFSDELTVIEHPLPDTKQGSTLRVSSHTASQLEYLFSRLKEKYEPLNQRNQFAVLTESVSSDQASGILVSLNKLDVPSVMTIQKLGNDSFLDPLIAQLWREHAPFRIVKNEVHFYERDRPVSEHTSMASECKQVFQRNGKHFKYHQNSNGLVVSIIQLYSGDMVIVDDVNDTFEYWPVYNWIEKPES